MGAHVTNLITICVVDVVLSSVSRVLAASGQDNRWMAF